MASDKVTVRVLEAHTYDGVAYEPGQTYEAEVQYLEFLELRKFAVRTDPAPPPPPPPKAK